MEEYLENRVTPTLDKLIQTCPRFRLLVIGRAGSGKSSLIDKVFKITSSEGTIDQEFIPDNNPRLVLHRHRYYDTGEGDPVTAVRAFIERRAAMPDLKDRLHAVWLCVPIPLSGGNMLNEHDTKILGLNVGSVPVIIAFTKCDLPALSSSSYTGYRDDAAIAQAQESVNNAVSEACASSLQAIDKDFPYRLTSTASGYEGTLAPFLTLTFERIQHGDSPQNPVRFGTLFRTIFGGRESDEGRVSSQETEKETAAIMFASAQRIDVQCKVDASVIVGRKEHWSMLIDNQNFKGKVMRQCANAIHRDMVLIWNLTDVEEYLMSRAFRSDVSKIVGDLGDPGLGFGPGESRSAYEDTMAMSRRPEYTHPITGLGLYFHKWAYEDYKQDRNTIRCLMGYIIDLNMILQKVLVHHSEGSIESVYRITDAYDDSHDKMRIHDTLRIFVRRARLASAMKRDFLLGRIITMIDEYRLRPSYEV